MDFPSYKSEPFLKSNVLKAHKINLFFFFNISLKCKNMYEFNTTGHKQAKSSCSHFNQN